MRLVHLLIAGLIAVGAMLAGLLAAFLVAGLGLVGWVGRFFRRKPAPAKPNEVPVARRAIFRRTETADVIDIEARPVADDAGRSGSKPPVAN